MLRRTLAAMTGLLGLPNTHPACAADFASTSRQLTLASWNLEWLLAPQTRLSLRNRCLLGDRHLPCDVVQDRPRSAADFHALAHEAAKLDADVIALQEVEGPAAATQVFSGYRFCFTQRRDWQNVGFAIRSGIAYHCDDDEKAVSLNDKVRRGAVLTLFPGEARELHLLAVHLKSGCSREPLDSPAANCRQLARQGPGIARWVNAQMAAGRTFAVLGDFNRDLRAERQAAAGLWATFAQRSDLHDTLIDAGGDTPFVACHNGQPFTRYIDYILLGERLAGRVERGSFARHPYLDRDAHQFRLSDHCPVSVALRLR